MEKVQQLATTLTNQQFSSYRLFELSKFHCIINHGLLKNISIPGYPSDRGVIFYSCRNDPQPEGRYHYIDVCKPWEVWLLSIVFNIISSSLYKQGQRSILRPRVEV